MNTDSKEIVAVAETEEKRPTLVVVSSGSDVEVSASTPNEMVVANQALISWASNKLLELGVELTDMEVARDKAIKNKWDSSAFKKQVLKIKKRIIFFEKFKQCLEHGYYIVPNFPVTAFVIRTKASFPNPIRNSYRSDIGDTEQTPQRLPSGEGDYKNPFQQVWHQETKISDQKTEHLYYSRARWEDIEFPMNMAKPHIIEAVERAMALKIFDDISILPDPTPKKKDPIIVGRLLNKVGPYNRKEYVTFMISWHLDTRAL